jgi:hypothetical protein
MRPRLCALNAVFWGAGLVLSAVIAIKKCQEREEG